MACVCVGGKVGGSTWTVLAPGESRVTRPEASGSIFTSLPRAAAVSSVPPGAMLGRKQTPQELAARHVARVLSAQMVFAEAVGLVKSQLLNMLRV